MMKTLCLVVFGFLVAGCSRSPETVFIAVFDELPPSVEVLHCYDPGAIDCCFWMHFTIAPHDFDRLSADYVQIEDLKLEDWERATGSALDWWEPEKFGKELLHFELYAEEGQQIKSFYTTVQRTEVYFAYWDN